MYKRKISHENYREYVNYKQFQSDIEKKFRQF